MNTPQFHFESLTVYQRALQFAKKIYLVTQKWPIEHRYGITDQLRRASISIVLNIAEGSSRTRKDFQHFLIVSRGSSYECIPLLKMAVELKLLSENDEQLFYNDVQEMARMLSGLRSSLKLKS